MILLTHIIFALGSILQATYTLVRPSHNQMRISYGLVTATLASGVMLVWQLQVSLMQPCLTGLLYIGAVTVLLVGANRRLSLASQAARTQDWSQYQDR